ncbi:MAG: hypothetical protein RLZZ127_944 [Planctomycetota bacterium]|jgi:hypothetical protein
MRLLAATVLACLTAPAWALQVQELTLFSPINGRPFQVQAPMPDQILGGQADMGSDDDGCRHDSGPIEYELYIAVDPHSYFAAQVAEWDARSGAFLARSQITPGFREWLVKTWNSEYQTDRANLLRRAREQATATGMPPVDSETFTIPQTAIPLHKRFRLALSSYEARGARPLALAKLANTGGWALRAWLNKPITMPALAGGFQEVNDRLNRKIKDGESFELAKWLPIYAEIADSRLTEEGKLVAGLAYFGLLLREGDLAKAQGVLDGLAKDLADPDKASILPGIVRERKAQLGHYVELTRYAAGHFAQAIGDEDVSRHRLVNTAFATAESFRRCGDLQRAREWYLAVARVAEGQPQLRAEIRAQGKVPGPTSPLAVQVAWMADRRVAELNTILQTTATDFTGPDRGVLGAMVFEDLGTSKYRSKTWTPVSGAPREAATAVLEETGKAVIEFAFREGVWPAELNELWDRDYVRDRNRLNRFHDPASGKPLEYAAPKHPLQGIDPNTVLVATPEPVTTDRGRMYGLFLANAKLVWSARTTAPGTVLAP